MQDLKDYLVGCFRLTITLGVINRRPTLCDSKLFAQILKILVLKLSSIVSNNEGRYTIPSYDVIHDEYSYNFTIFYGERDYLYPLNEVVYSGNDEIVSI